MLPMKHLISLRDVTKTQITQLIESANDFKEKLRRGEPHRFLESKTLGMIFGFESTRTRSSWATAMAHLGGYPIFLNPKELHAFSKDDVFGEEPLEDTCKVLSRFFDAILHRTSSHDLIKKEAKYSSIPIINAADDFEHPTQALSDLLTIKQKKGAFEGVKLGCVGEPTVLHSLLFSGPKLGMSMFIAFPEGYENIFDKGVVNKARRISQNTGCEIRLTNDLNEAIADADVVYSTPLAPVFWLTDKSKEQVLVDWKKYQITNDVLKLAKNDKIYMHPLPAPRKPAGLGLVTDEVINDPSSVVFDQAENKLHMAKAILVSLLMKQ